MTKTKNTTTKNQKAKFSRFNQPVACRMCGKKTTWSEANGNGGLDLCRDCFDAASLENEHNDGHHAETPSAKCPQCARAQKSFKAASKKPVTKKGAKALAADLAAGKELAKDSLGEVVPESPAAARVAAQNTANLEAATGPNAKFPFGIKVTKDGHVTYERFKTAKERDKRAASLKDAAEKYDWQQPAADPKPAKKSAAKKTAAPKKERVKDDTIRMKLYPTGEFYFQRVAAARLEGFTHVAVEIKGKAVTLTPTKSTKDTTEIGKCHAAPVLRVGKLLAATGWSKAKQDLTAKPVGEHAMTVEVK